MFKGWGRALLTRPHRAEREEGGWTVVNKLGGLGVGLGQLEDISPRRPTALLLLLL